MASPAGFPRRPKSGGPVAWERAGPTHTKLPAPIRGAVIIITTDKIILIIIITVKNRHHYHTTILMITTAIQTKEV